jgi:hypothetical protein
MGKLSLKFSQGQDIDHNRCIIMLCSFLAEESNQKDPRASKSYAHSHAVRYIPPQTTQTKEMKEMNGTR